MELKELDQFLKLDIDRYIIELDSLFNKVHQKDSMDKKKLKTKNKKKQILIQVPVIVHKQVIINDTVLK